MTRPSGTGTRAAPGPGTWFGGPEEVGHLECFADADADADADAEVDGSRGGDGEDTVYGLLQVGGVDIALPLAVLREVVPCPQRLDPLPGTAPAVLGAMHLRRTVLPVVDLGVLLGGGPGAALPLELRRGAGGGARFVVVVAHAGRLVGLLVDELCGVGEVPPRLVQDVRAQQGELLLSGAFHHLGTDRVVSVLDVGVILRRTGVPTIPDHGRGQTVRADAAMSTTARAAGPDDRPGRSRHDRPKVLTLVRAGEHALALSVAHVHTTLPRVRPTASVLSSELCLGVVEYAGLEVPVVDPLVLLGLGRLDRVPEHPAGLVLDLGTGYVVMALDALVDLQEVDPGQVLSVPPFALPAPDLVAGLLDVPDRPACLVLDGDTLLTDSTLASMASVNVTLAVSPAATPGMGLISGPGSRSRRRRPDETDDVIGHPDLRPHLAYDCGVRAVTPLEQVDEVVPYQAALIGTGIPGEPRTPRVTEASRPLGVTVQPGGPTPGADGATPALLGLFAHRGAAVPVLDLSQQLGLAPCEPGMTACLLLVQGQGGPVAYLVSALDRIQSVAWADAEHTPEHGHNPPLEDTLPQDRYPEDARLEGRTDPGGTTLRRPLLERAQLVRLDQETQLLPRLDLLLLTARVENRGH